MIERPKRALADGIFEGVVLDTPHDLLEQVVAIRGILHHFCFLSKIANGFRSARPTARHTLFRLCRSWHETHNRTRCPWSSTRWRLCSKQIGLEQLRQRPKHLIQEMRLQLGSPHLPPIPTVAVQPQ